MRAIASVKAQSYPVSNIIVVDDGSAEEVGPILKKKYPDVIYLRNSESQGAPFSRNRGWKHAGSELIAFLDSDDEMKPDNLSRKVGMLIEQGLDMVIGSIELNENGKVSPQKFKITPDRPLRDHLLLNTPFDARTSTFVIKRQVLESISFDHNLKKHQDWDLFINVDYHYNVGYTNYCDTTLHIASDDRISSKLQHESTKYFITKNQTKVSDQAMFMFLLKMLYKSQIRRDHEGTTLYRTLLAGYKRKVNFTSEIIIFLVKYKILNVSLLQKLKKLLKS
ncbi:glycosyl transferase, group 2 family protein [Fulvivirga imtechensis AK7]|uniref:Glycosyl transferase, group 2 family protein n=2 Tax=Fulvivirga TaxID=396811 RepID=L8JQW3_9BACT|nr:glycosyl transferase, group 2 family protein [Fulvivirga imtechensis AK7]